MTGTLKLGLNTGYWAGGPPPGAGTLFGLALKVRFGVFFVDDGTNTLNLLH